MINFENASDIGIYSANNMWHIAIGGHDVTWIVPIVIITIIVIMFFLILVRR